jgi:hypothetical protein
MAWAMNDLPTPVWPMSNSGRPSLSQPRLWISRICALVIERCAV